MDVLIKNMTLPTEDEQVNITILSDGSVIEHFRTEKGRWTSYRSGGVKAVELPPHGRLIEAHFDYAEFKKRYKDAFGDNFELYNAFSIFNDMVVNALTVLEAST